MVSLALFQPDIPQNAGAVIRLCAVFEAPLHIIEPCGFVWNEKKMSRAAMDYYTLCNLTRHSSWQTFEETRQPDSHRLIALTTHTDDSIYDFDFKQGDILLAGRESSGLPDDIHDTADARVTIPQKQGRSLNVSMACAVALTEAMRQINNRTD